jgi:hypothetical protein
MISEARGVDAPESNRDNDRTELVSLLRAHGYQTERIANLSTKLRLTNQSRWSSARAADQHRRRTSGARPSAAAAEIVAVRLMEKILTCINDR